MNGFSVGYGEPLWIPPLGSGICEQERFSSPALQGSLRRSERRIASAQYAVHASALIGGQSPETVPTAKYKMKPKIIFSYLAIVFLICLTAMAAPGVHAQTSPEGVIKSFYNGYIRATAKGVEPLGKRSTLRKYLTANIIKKQVDAYEASQDADYFLQSQEYEAKWENAFTISKPVVKGAVATAVVDFPGGYPRVKVTLRKAEGMWKIDRVQNAQR